MSKNLKLKKKVKKRFILVLIVAVLSITAINSYKTYLYKQTYEYKLLEKNYTLEDSKILTEKFTNKELDELLVKEYNASIMKLINEKYFIFENLDKYMAYQNKNSSVEINNIVALVNVNRNSDFYENKIATDVTKNSLMLVNKYNFLGENYVPENLTKTTATYSYENNSLNKETYEAFIKLADQAKIEGYTILIVSSYRDFKFQDEIWSSRKSMYGTRKADQYAARAGHSEHQSGYALDVADFYDTNDKFGETESYKWMIDNSYKFGFILRYPKDKEDVTGYSYEPWHYRYVGKKAADIIYKNNITFDEYYAFYLR